MPATISTVTATTWNRDKIDNLLRTNDRAVYRAIVALYQRQTADEKARQDTIHRNHVGFSAAHARAATYFAQLVLSGRTLYPKALAKARKIALRHSKQLVVIANARN